MKDVKKNDKDDDNSLKQRNLIADRFFFEYYNDNISDESFIKTIKDMVYNEVLAEIIKFSQIGEIDYKKFTILLYRKISKKNIIKDEKK